MYACYRIEDEIACGRTKLTTIANPVLVVLKIAPLYLYCGG